MRNSYQKGDVLTLTAPYDVVSGAGVKFGLIFGIATSAALSTAAVEVQTVGVVDLLAVTADTASVGAAIYWDDTAKKATTTVGSNIKIGVAVGAKVGTDTTVRVRLNGSF
jgi:predicted RecA/RadA family phage recombinase